MNVYFAKIPYHLYKEAQEGFYHTIFMILLEGMGIKTRGEDPTNIGRIDLAFDIDKTTYIIEFKLDQDGESAFKQADLRRYKEKYSQGENHLAVLGVNFSSQSRNISDWKGELFSPSGKSLKTFASTLVP
ncbi:PD-(D/E)XK nuclease domain-containing protein [Candidatus Neptunochlamydia vexilliferae]|uniref:PD-(D/E)XK nuclease superfamily protein n=1 Tax=Candidatus Neptunichlamydia vexilliferae TaxID=1651774 RepID=A0ABS0B0D0_9BACT|nr:PD-(D/E)XK nuclease domain-containing protein [Candidatus Neptunochlamydia vexilliferae]MBF5059848.1 hypothetical protein [Candidatus Neptunochlamydia vexilliferae]